jgi:hypothetical protein
MHISLMSRVIWQMPMIGRSDVIITEPEQSCARVRAGQFVPLLRSGPSGPILLLKDTYAVMRNATLCSFPIVPPNIRATNPVATGAPALTLSIHLYHKDSWGRTRSSRQESAPGLFYESVFKKSVELSDDKYSRLAQSPLFSSHFALTDNPVIFLRFRLHIK